MSPGGEVDTTEDAPPPVQSVAAVLGKVRAWRDQSADEHKRQLLEVDGEIVKIKQAVEELQRQLTALDGFREELASQRAELEREHAQRAHDEMFRLLQKQAKALASRATDAQNAAKTRESVIEACIQQSDMGKVLEEHAQFRSGLPQLQQLPASYRDALVAHHTAQAGRIKTFVQQADPGPPQLDAPELCLDVIYTVDAVEDEPALISIVMPIVEAAHTEWRDRDEDLQLQMAARVVQAVYTAAHELGMTRSHAMYGGHRGLLAVELELGGDHGTSLGPRLERALTDILGQAPELGLVSVTPRVQHVPVDYLLPPSASTEENDDVA
jgi:hypothetical protein